MKMYHRCPKCGGTTFLVTAHVTQTWKVDEEGDFISEVSSCDEITHKPDDDDIWTCANSKCDWSSAGSEALVDKKEVEGEAENEERKKMTVREVAENNRNAILDMMSPVGFLRVAAQELLSGNTVETNPGCSECFMSIEAEEILDMKVTSKRIKDDAIYMMVE